jgi:hypothetical protein
MMKVLSLAAAAAILAHQAAAHYIWTDLTIGGTKGTGAAGGIRPNTNYNSPITDLSSNNLRCNEGGLSGSGVAVRTIQAGSQFTFHSDVAVYHQGPVTVYLSKASGDVTSYDGSGDWFKIAELGPTFNGGSASWQLNQQYTFTLPSCVAPGQYLLRIEQLGIHNPWPAGVPQFYVGCAQISVTGGSGSLSGSVKIPGHVKESDPGYTANIYNPDFKSYTVPGGSVAKC